MPLLDCVLYFVFFFQAEDGIRDLAVTGVQTCALPIYLTQSIETVELARLRVELDGEPHAVAGRDVADLLDAARGGLDVARAHVDGTHHRGAAQTGRPFALLGEDAEQAAPHVAIRPHPSVLDADTRHRQAAFLHDVDDGVGVHALLGRAHEIDAAQLDGLPARLAGRAQRLGERGRVQRPRVKGQSEAHGRYCTWLLSRPMEPCLQPRGSRPPRHRRRAPTTAPGTSGFTGVRGWGRGAHRKGWWPAAAPGPRAARRGPTPATPRPRAPASAARTPHVSAVAPARNAPNGNTPPKISV